MKPYTKTKMMSKERNITETPDRWIVIKMSRDVMGAWMKSIVNVIKQR